MIEQIELSNFKCFELLKLPLGSLTVLSGANASGKSSVLQAFLLLHQTMCEDEWSARLMLNGDVAQLGTVTDVVDQVNGRDRFSVAISSGNARCHWTFSGDRQDMSLAVDNVEAGGKIVGNPKRLRNLLPLDVDDDSRAIVDQVSTLTYISAERAGPAEVYPLQDQGPRSGVGPEGRNAVSVLLQGRDEPIAKELQIEGVGPTLLRQVEARLGEFFPGCTLQVQQVSNANAVTLGVKTSQATEFLRPIHCGFGITQVLPIVVAILSARIGSLLLIENPEVHLHPAGQAHMGQFLAEVSNAGLQVFIETHSDHVLNGIRRSVKAKKVPPEKTTIHFFRTRAENETQVSSPTLDSSGNIDFWPEGFFDQFERDMYYFADWGG